jgi:hypothetical protein
VESDAGKPAARGWQRQCAPTTEHAHYASFSRTTRAFADMKQRTGCKTGRSGRTERLVRARSFIREPSNGRRRHMLPGVTRPQAGVWRVWPDLSRTPRQPPRAKGGIQTRYAHECLPGGSRADVEPGGGTAPHPGNEAVETSLYEERPQFCPKATRALVSECYYILKLTSMIDAGHR